VAFCIARQKLLAKEGDLEIKNLAFWIGVWYNRSSTHREDKRSKKDKKEE